MEDELLKRIDHVGVIVRDIEEAVKLFSEVFGFKTPSSPYMDSQGEFESVLLVAGDVNLELIAPINLSGALANFLERRGEGLHHISIEVDDIDQELESLKAKGVRLVDEKAQVVRNNNVAFLHPIATKGTLVELTEKVPM